MVASAELASRPNIVGNLCYSTNQGAGRRSPRPWTRHHSASSHAVRIERIIEYAVQQRLIPCCFTVDERFDETSRKMN
jgi:hypothetical protein